MMEREVSWVRFSLTSGITIGAVAVLVTMLERIEALVGVVSILRFILLISMSMYFIRVYRDRYNEGHISGGRSFAMALIMMLCVGVVAMVYTYIKTSGIPPATYDEMIVMMKDVYEEQGVNLPDESWDKVVEMIPYASSLMALLGHVFLGAMVGAVAAMSIRR